MNAIIPVAPPGVWFENPRLKGVTPLTVTPEGRVYGHLASWKECHLDYGGSCVTAPRSRTGYARFKLGAVLTAEGTEVSTGPIVMSAPHADPRSNMAAAFEHYGNNAHPVADVAAGEDKLGIWIAGALRPSVTAEQVRVLRASPLSGDWRTDPNTGALELVAALATVVPGFAIPRPRALVASGGGMVSLLAVGMVPTWEQTRAADLGVMGLDVLAMEVGLVPAHPAPRTRSEAAAFAATFDEALVASMSTPGATVQPWSGVLGVEGLLTGDGRVIAPDALSPARLPMPLRWSPIDTGGHDGAVIVGRIDAVTRDPSGIIYGSGVLDLGSQQGAEAARLMEAGMLSGVSFDLDSVDATEVPSTGSGGLIVTTAGRIRAATLVAIPAFDEARVELSGAPIAATFALAVASGTEECGCGKTTQTMTTQPVLPALTF